MSVREGYKLTNTLVRDPDQGFQPLHSLAGVIL